MKSERLGQNISGLRHGPFGGVDEQQDAVDEGKRALDLPSEVGVAGSVDEVDLGALPLDRCGLGENRDASLALLVTGVHDAVDSGLMRGEDTGRGEHCVHQRRLAVVDVRDQRDVAKRSSRHGAGMVAVARFH